MKNRKKLVIALLAVVVVIAGFIVDMFRSGVITYIPKQKTLPGGEFTVDFTEADAGSFVFNTRSEWITVSCTRCIGTEKVHIELYVSVDDVGYIETDHYTDLDEGESCAMRLPEGNKYYQLIFTAPNGKIRSANFTVKTGQPATTHYW